MTQPYELLSDPVGDAIRAFHARQAGLWTALPGIVQSFDATAMTCVVQPAIQAVVFAPDGSAQDVNLPLLLDCPVQFPGGGGCTLTFPVKKGDECLVVFASRCIDAWWYSGGVQPQAEMRMHDLSDGFALVGVRSQPRVLAGVSTTAAQLRTDDGQAYLAVDPATHEVAVQTSSSAKITAAQNVDVQAATASVTAPNIYLGASGQTLLAFVTAAFQALFNGHTHTSGSAGAATSAPNQQMDATHMTTTVKGG